jgi:hypothetical protein
MTRPHQVDRRQQVSGETAGDEMAVTAAPVGRFRHLALFTTIRLHMRLHA